MGGFPAYCALIRRRIARPASKFKAPSSQPPLGTESMCPPIKRACSDSPARVAQTFPASSRWTSRGSSSSFLRSQARACAHVAVKATRWAPFSSEVSALSSLSSLSVILGSSSAHHYLAFSSSARIAFDLALFSKARTKLGFPPLRKKTTIAFRISPS